MNKKQKKMVSGLLQVQVHCLIGRAHQEHCRCRSWKNVDKETIEELYAAYCEITPRKKRDVSLGKRMLTLRACIAQGGRT